MYPTSTNRRSLDSPVLKSVTKDSLQPPTGKQFVIRAADGALEYMPDDLVREVITGVEHTEIIVCIEDVGRPVNFDIPF
ncbi:unnamed protein product [Rhizophagus irregularis]|nr:unnamed protein product [Rhizophagus irregularis]